MRFEIMDGSPSREGDSDTTVFGWVRFDADVQGCEQKYSTGIYLSLVLIDEDARRYLSRARLYCSGRRRRIAAGDAAGRRRYRLVEKTMGADSVTAMDYDMQFGQQHGRASGRYGSRFYRQFCA